MLQTIQSIYIGTKKALIVSRGGLLRGEVALLAFDVGDEGTTSRTSSVSVKGTRVAPCSNLREIHRNIFLFLKKGFACEHGVS